MIGTLDVDRYSLALPWMNAIIGFGTHHYVYASGREGDMPLVGFSPRKAAIDRTIGALKLNKQLNTDFAVVWPGIDGYENGFGDHPSYQDVGNVGASGFTAPGSGDFSAATTIKAVGMPGTFENTSAYRGYMDNGAVQRQEPVAGGDIVVRRKRQSI